MSDNGSSSEVGLAPELSRDKRKALEEIQAGLRLPQKMISPKYFYDERGSKLFEKICELPEYYLTRTEVGIMQAHAGEMANAIGPRPYVIEFGIGSGLKTRLLLDALLQPVAFAPVDISAEHLAETVNELALSFPDIEMLPVAADFTQPFPLSRPSRSPNRNLVYFPGSTIGNFEAAQAGKLLRVMRQMAGKEGCIIIGIDLKKDSYIIDNAYNDSQEITSSFNLNLLRHLNREFGTDFDIGQFRHQAIYDETAGRIEMRLVSQCKQTVRIAGLEANFTEGESIITEYSHKYSPQEFLDLADSAGFAPVQAWTDANQWFGIHLLRCKD